MTCVLNFIATKIHYGTKVVVESCHQISDYVAMHPNATIQCIASDMILLVHSNASYLLEQNIKSLVGGYYYLSSAVVTTPAN